MTPAEFVKKIKNYAVVSFFVPLIAINSCLLIYKFLGDLDNINLFTNSNWNKDELTYTFKEYNLINNNRKLHTYTNCPKYTFNRYFTTIDDQIIRDLNSEENKLLVNNLVKSNKIKFVTFKKGKNINYNCIKNHPSLSFIEKFSWLEKILIRAKIDNPVGFVKIKNPYFYGEVSISRTARFFPNIFIFKPFIVLSGLLLFLYWKNNLNLFSELKDKNILDKFSKKFFYLGILSCIFLIFHSIFLGLDIDSKLFVAMRKTIIILFILFEVLAQILLTKNLFKFREELKKYINPLILKIKIIFVTTVFFITLVAFTILSFGDPSTAFKHILEWNYFSYLLFYYLLSRLLWK